MIIALNQLTPKANDLAANVSSMEQTIKQNAAAGAKLCVFPEDYLFGVLRDKKDFTEAGVHFDALVSRLCELAKKYRVDLVPGTLPRVVDESIFNTAVYIDKSGKLLARYAKHNLWLNERDELQPSREKLQVFQSILGPTAIIICWDMLDHTLFESAVKQGAKWIICPVFWMVNTAKDLKDARGTVTYSYGKCYSSSRFLDDLATIRAIEYNVGILVCNFAEIHTYRGRNHIERAISAGRTLVVTPYKKLYKKINKRKQATLLVDIDRQAADQTIADLEILYGRRQDVTNNYPYGSSVPEHARLKTDINPVFNLGARERT